MTAKPKGRPLPPLLPLEYCRLDRAARMLECEVGDLIHWAGTGAIKLVYSAKNLESQTYFNKQQFKYLFTSGNFETGFRHKNELYGVNLGLSIDFDRMYPDGEELSAAFENLLTNDEPQKFSEVYAYISMFGFFAIHSEALKELDRTGQCSSFILTLDGTAVTESYFFPILGSDFSIEMLFIEKPELDKVYQAITSGKIFTTEEKETPTKIHSTETMQLLSKAKVAAERNSAPRAELVLSLLELILGEDSSIIDNPYTLYEIVNRQLRERNISEPEITQQAFADILSKAKSARKNRLKNPS